ncbi:hypothetical protein Tco_0528081 [Tanacetum coccineum]
MDTPAEPHLFPGYPAVIINLFKLLKISQPLTVSSNYTKNLFRVIIRRSVTNVEAFAIQRRIGLHTNVEEQGYLILNKTTQGTSKELHDARLGAGNRYYCTYDLETLTIWYEEHDEDIYAAGLEYHPPMLNKDNYIPWSSRLLRYAKSKPNGKLLIDDELTIEEAKQVEADDQDIQTILMVLPEDIYVANQDEVNEVRAERLARTHDPLAFMGNTQTPYTYPVFHPDQPSHITYMKPLQPNNNYVQQPPFNMNYMHKPMQNPKAISDPTTAMNMELIAQPGQNARNKIRYKARQNAGNQIGYNAMQNARNQNGNGNLVAARAEGNGNGNNANQIRCYNCRGVDYEEIEEVNANCILIANLQQASTSGTHADKAHVYDLDGSTKDDSNVIPVDSSMDPSGGIIEQHHATIEETHAFYESLYNNLVIEVEKVNTVNCETKEANVKLTAELARYRGREKFFEFNQARFDVLENGYRKSIYQEQCLTKKINALHLSSSKIINTLNEQITNLNNQLSKEKSIVPIFRKKGKS